MNAAARQVLLTLLLFVGGCEGSATLVYGIPPEPSPEGGAMEGGGKEGGAMEGGGKEGGAMEAGGTDGGATDAVQEPVSEAGQAAEDAALDEGAQ